MEKIVRPESMERITTPELAQKFIEEQIAEIRAQVGSKKVKAESEKEWDLPLQGMKSTNDLPCFPVSSSIFQLIL